MKKRALLSVFDKEGILDFAKFLVKHNYEIVSSGGTYKYLKENNIYALDISEVTNFPEMLDGRVKTLHPNVHGGILAIRDNKDHMETIDQHKIVPIDFVVVNLYPFFEKVKQNLTFQEKVEFIDIGGPTMLRAAAKNFQDVVVICDRKDYARVINEYESNGSVSQDLKRELAGKVFNLMSAYDGAISKFLLQTEYPNYLANSFIFKQELRYGENPHQSAAFYSSTMINGAMNTFELLNGKELSYNNINDADICWKVVCEFEEPACCAVKHKTPCGVAIGSSSSEAYQKAHDADPTSIFGGIVAINKKIDRATAEQMVKIFLEVVIAPEYDADALEVLKTKKNLRILKMNKKPQDVHGMVTVDGGILVQTEDNHFSKDLRVVTKRQPSTKEREDMIFAMKVVKYVKSNAIIVASNGVALGIGGGQVNRLWPTIDALRRGKNATVLASDAFFPFADVVDEIAKYKNITAIIQPGGSIRDQDSIDACDKHNLSMIFTGIRHFKH